MSSRCLCVPMARLPGAARLNNLNMARPFTTTSANLKVPPESPHWIQVPTPPQSQDSEVKLPKVKGTLPVPRDPFPRQEGDRKVRNTYFRQTAPEPSNAFSRWNGPKGSRHAHNRDMARSRRQNLREALRGLYERKQKHVKAATATSRRLVHGHKLAAEAPDRWDDVFTRSSVLSTLATSTSVALDPERYDRAEQSKAATAALAQKKKDAKQDALMEMYINASKFIVSEDELSKELDRLFAVDYWQKQGKTTQHDNDNAWDVWGQPPTVQSMLDDMLRKQQRAIDFQQSEQDRTVKRQKNIAEELTGGKME